MNHITDENIAYPSAKMCKYHLQTCKKCKSSVSGSSFLDSVVKTSISHQIARPEETQPVFLVPIQDVTIKEGESARFDCQVQSLPEASVVWYHQDKPLKSDDIYQIIPGEDGQSSLVIAEAFPEDAGEYTVHAVSSAGEATCSAVLTVEGRSLIDFSGRRLSCLFFLGLYVSHVW